MAKNRSVASLAVSVVARVDKFLRNMKRARGVIGKFGVLIKSTAATVGVLTGAIATLVGPAAIALLVRKAFQLNDVLGKTADKLGIAVENLSALTLAGRLSGVQANTFTMALQRMTRRVSEAAVGTGEAKAAILELNLSAKRLNMLSPDKMFIEIARAMERVKNQSDRVRLAFKLFDSEGVALVNTLGLGVNKLQEIAEFAARAGITLSRFDISMIEQANDAVTKFKAAVMGLVNQLAVALAPVIKAVADHVTNLLVSIDKNALREFFVQVFELGVVAVAQFVKWIVTLDEKLQSLKVAALEAGHGILSAFSPFKGVPSDSFFAIDRVREAQAELAKIKDANKAQIEAIDAAVAVVFGNLARVGAGGGAGGPLNLIKSLFEKRDVRARTFMDAMGKSLLKSFEPMFKKIRNDIVDPIAKVFGRPVSGPRPRSGSFVALLESELGFRGQGAGPVLALGGRIENKQLTQLQQQTSLLGTIVQILPTIGGLL